MRFLSLALLIFAIAACSSYTRKPASQPKAPRHVVIFIHGIGSNTKDSFGSMPDYLKNTYGWQVIKFNYDTLNETKAVWDFAKDLARTLRESFEDQPLTDIDQISIVMHSQGGLVGFTWIENAFKGAPEYAPEFTPFVKRFITLGTPMWGAKTARAGDLTNDNIPINGTVLQSNQQLQDMSYGSRLYHLRRKYLIDESNAELRKRIDSQVRFLHVAGWASELKPLGLLTDGINYESDTTVPIASTRYEHLFAVSVLENYSEGHLLGRNRFQLTETHPYRLIHGWHATGTLGNNLINGVAFTPESCLRSKCTHEATTIVEDFLNDRKTEEKASLQKNITSFIVELRILLPENSLLTRDNVKVHFDAYKSKLSTLFKGKALSIGDPFEIMSQAQRRFDDGAEKKEKVLRYYYTGVSRTKNKDQTQAIRTTISGPDAKTRIVDIPVRAGYTTYLELNLETK
jgi:pimeloyl-ACP methyl ester carboxylesterase